MEKPFIFKTINSTYELNIERRLIRRIHGQNPSNPRQGRDGEWKQFARIVSPLQIGKTFVILWEMHELPDGSWKFKTTETSPVINIGEPVLN